MKKTLQILKQNISHKKNNYLLFVFLLIPFLLFSSITRNVGSKNLSTFLKLNSVSRIDKVLEPGPLAKTLTGNLKIQYEKLVAEGLVPEEDQTTIYLKHIDPALGLNLIIASITNNKITYTYRGFGGNIVITWNKTVTLIGHNIDNVDGYGLDVFFYYKTGKNPMGLNIFTISNWSWEKNEAWLQEAVDRKDIIRLTSNPLHPKTLYINGRDGDLTVTGREIKFLESLGFVWDPDSFEYKYPFENEEDHNDIHELIGSQYENFSNFSKSVCMIINHDGYRIGTGALINNTKMDGSMYVITAAHLLANDNDDYESFDIMNNNLKNFKFNFQYERPQGDNSDSFLPIDNRFTLTGAEIVSFYSENEMDDGSYNVEPIDIVLLRLKQRPISNNQLYLGWNLNYDATSSNEDYTIIHHPAGMPKKISMPINGELVNTWKKIVPNSEDDIRISSPIYNQDPPENIPEILPLRSLINAESDNGYLAMFYPNRFGFPEGGSSGSPYVNNMGQIFATHFGVVLDNNILEDEMLFEENYSQGSLLNTIMWNNNPSNHDLGRFNGALRSFLDPFQVVNGQDISPITSLYAAYPCQGGIQALTYSNQNIYQRNLTFTEPISSDVNQTYIAQDKIEISSKIEPGARLLFTAGEVELKQDTEIRAGDANSGTNVEILSGGMSGIGCVTGCYGIENIGGYLKRDGSVYGQVKGAQKVEVSILIDGIDVSPGVQEIKSEPIWLFNIKDSGIDKAGVYELKAKYTSDCDELIVDYEVIIENSDLNHDDSDYYAYANAVFPEADYLLQKKEIATDYVASSSYDFNSIENKADDVLYEVDVARDIPYAMAWGVYSQSPVDGSLVSCSFTRGIDHCFTSSVMETQAKDLGHLYRGQLKMDVYYPRMRFGVQVNQSKKLPLILYVFGGAFSAHPSPSDGLSDATCRWLASKGYVVASIDYRVGVNLDKVLGARAAYRAHQDLKAAIRYWELKPLENLVFGVSRKWSIDTNRIYGLGWSSGGITVLNNVYLNQEVYDIESMAGGLLFGTTAKHIVTLDACPNDDPITGCGLPIQYNTYDLENYETSPCVGNVNDPCSSVSSVPQNTRLRKGVSFAGAIASLDWMESSNIPTADIHHREDGVVPFGEGKPFGYLGSIASSFGTVGLNTLYGGGAMQPYSESKIGTTNFSLLALEGKDKAGGKQLTSSYHRPQLLFGAKKGVEEVEPKIMYYVDAFFSNTTNSPQVNQKAVSINYAIQSPKSIISLVPNPTSDLVTVHLETQTSGEIHLKIASMDGKIIHKETKQLNTGKHQLPIVTKTLSSGIYIVSAEGMGIKTSENLVIKK